MISKFNNFTVPEPEALRVGSVRVREKSTSSLYQEAMLAVSCPPSFPHSFRDILNEFFRLLVFFLPVDRFLQSAGGDGENSTELNEHVA
jgi:hypothetical protein